MRHEHPRTFAVGGNKRGALRRMGLSAFGRRALAGTRPGGRLPFLFHDKKGSKETCPAVSPATPVPSLRAVSPAGPELAALKQQDRTTPAKPPSTRRARGGQGASSTVGRNKRSPFRLLRRAMTNPEKLLE